MHASKRYFMRCLKRGEDAYPGEANTSSVQYAVDYWFPITTNVFWCKTVFNYFRYTNDSLITRVTRLRWVSRTLYHHQVTFNTLSYLNSLYQLPRSKRLLTRLGMFTRNRFYRTGILATSNVKRNRLAIARMISGKMRTATLRINLRCSFTLNSILHISFRGTGILPISENIRRMWLSLVRSGITTELNIVSFRQKYPNINNSIMSNRRTNFINVPLPRGMMRLIVRCMNNVFPFKIIRRVKLKRVFPNSRITTFSSTNRIATMNTKVMVNFTILRLKKGLLRSTSINMRNLMTFTNLGRDQLRANLTGIVSGIVCFGTVRPNFARHFNKRNGKAMRTMVIVPSLYYPRGMRNVLVFLRRSNVMCALRQFSIGRVTDNLRV